MGLVEAVKGGVGTVVCAGLGASSWVAGLLSDVGLPASGIQEAIDSQRAVGCGVDPSGLGPVLPPPQFTGGQCETAYNASWRIIVKSRTSGAVQDPSSVNRNISPIQGAVTGYRFAPVGEYPDGALEFLSGDEVVLRSELGQFFSFQIIEVIDLEFTRVDGLPDDCGDPESPTPPPIQEHDDVLPPITYPDKDDNPITLPDLPVKFFRPCVNLDGVRIPFEVDLGFTKICGKVGIGFDIADFDVSPNIDIDVCPEQKKDVGIPRETVEEYFDLTLVGSDDTTQELSGDLSSVFDPESPKILGVFIRARQINSSLSRVSIVDRANPSEPKLLLPRIGEVTFECFADEKTIFETGFAEPIPIKNVQQFIPCPSPFGAVSVKVNWEDGWGGGYYEARRKDCCEACSKKDPNEGLDNWDRCRVD